MTTSNDAFKRAAGFQAAAWIEDGMVVGLGTGSTVRHLLDAIAERRASGELSRIVGIPTSEDTRRRSEALGIPLGDLNSHPEVDLTIDGTDEFDPVLDLIKGLGGALLREKLVALASADLVIVADETKRVRRLGEKAPVPVEIDPFAISPQQSFLARFGCRPVMRFGSDGQPYRTDGGNVILDCHFEEGIPDPADFADALDVRTGVLEHGLFLGMARRIVVAGSNGVDILQRGVERVVDYAG